MKKHFKPAFTIVELLTVVIVIAILATITMVAYNGITNNAKESALKSDLRNASTKIQLAQAETGNYPEDTANLPKSKDITYQYTTNGNSTFCITATTTQLPNKSFYTDQDGSIKDGTCPGDTNTPIASGSHIQTVTAANCSTARTMVVDARDNHTYWIQKMPDSKCWMLTNLAYAGGTANGGTNQYGDVKTLQNGTADTASARTLPKYYVPSNANATVNPATPNVTSYDDVGDELSQTGYYYNWCAATGVQMGTTGCANIASPIASASISICPTGWRLPVSGPSDNESEFRSLGVLLESNPAAQMWKKLLVQGSGSWEGGYYDDSFPNIFFGSTQASSSSAHAGIFFGNGVTSKAAALPIRCILI